MFGSKADYWFYIKDDKVNGPVHEDELQEMFQKGLLKPETLVKSFAINWTQAKNTKLFRQKILHSPGSSYYGNIFRPAIDKEQSSKESPANSKRTLLIIKIVLIILLISGLILLFIYSLSKGSNLHFSS